MRKARSGRLVPITGKEILGGFAVLIRGKQMHNGYYSVVPEDVVGDMNCL